MRDQRIEVCHASAYGLVENVIRGRNRSRPRRRKPQSPPCIAKRDKEIPCRSLRRRPSLPVATADFDKEESYSAGLKLDREACMIFAERIRRRIEPQRCLTQDVIKPCVSEGDAARREIGRLHDPATLAPGATHLKQIGKIGGKADGQRYGVRLIVEIHQSDTLE